MTAEETIFPMSPDRNPDLSLVVPPDKSLTHRAIMFAGCATGVSTIQNPLLSDDCRSTQQCLTELGVTFISTYQGDSHNITVHSPGWDHWQTPLQPLDCGNSGTTARLMMGFLAGADGITATLTGDDSLRHRPMGRVVDPLRRMGARIKPISDLLPLTIEGTILHPVNHQLSIASAQLKSALLVAAARCSGVTTVTLPAGSRDHTERWLRWLGGRCDRKEQGGFESITVSGPFQPKTFTVRIPGDPSSAAFFAVLGLMRPRGRVHLSGVGVNPTRTGFINVLRSMGANIELQAGQTPPHHFPEPVADLEISGGQSLVGARLMSSQVPATIDEIPILAVAASFAYGISHFQGLGELRYKESDRLSMLEHLLKSAGIKIEGTQDDLRIEGVGSGRIKAFTYDSQGDHRMAMAAAILAKRADGPCTIKGASCVTVSFPTFFEMLRLFD